MISICNSFKVPAPPAKEMTASTALSIIISLKPYPIPVQIGIFTKPSGKVFFSPGKKLQKFLSYCISPVKH